MVTLLAFIFAIIVVAVLIGFFFVYDTLTWGLVLYKFWGWFVLPVFITLPALTFTQAIGLMFVVSLFKSNFAGEGLADEYKKNKYAQVWQVLLLPWIALLFGWLAYSIWVG
jgi:hypothetical protein